VRELDILQPRAILALGKIRVDAYLETEEARIDCSRAAFVLRMALRWN
jgi:uracil-DNA glycosylase